MKFFSYHRTSSKILGLTLLELVVSISLLAVLLLVVTKIFTTVTNIQNRTKDEQSIEGDLRYAMGVFVDEVRSTSLHTATEVDCPDSSCQSKYYCVDATNSILYLRDKNNICVTYSLSGNNLLVNRGGTNYTITSNDVTVNSLKFSVSALGDRVLVKMKATGVSDYNKSISYQTAITSTQLR